MTKCERASLIVSIVALAVSVTFPLISFFWLNSHIQDRRYAPDLRYQTVDHDTKDGYQLEVEIENTGKTPANEVSVHFKPINRFIRLPEEPDLQCDPICSTQYDIRGDKLSVTLRRSIGPGEKQKITLPGILKPEFGGQGLVLCKVYDSNGEAEHYHAASVLDKDIFDF
tara:strand:- start:96717 stop:97223 length:507 start_codon:yes stop_codon:yes gene_type:complete